MALDLKQEDMQFLLQRINANINGNKYVRDVLDNLKGSDKTKDITVFSVLTDLKKHIDELAAEEMKKNPGETGSAQSLQSFLVLIGQLRENLVNLAGNYKSENRELDFIRLQSQLRAVATAVKEQKLLENFFEKYSYCENRRSDVQLLVGLCQGIVNSNDIIEDMERKAEVNLAAQRIKSVTEDGKLHYENVQKFINDVIDAGIEYDEFEAEYEKIIKENQKNENIINKLKDDDYHKKLQQQYDERIKELEEGVFADTKKINELASKIDTINNFELILRQREKTVTAAEEDVKSASLRIADLNLRLDDTVKLLNEQIAKIDESQDINDRISRLLSDSDAKKAIETAESEPERAAVLETAFASIKNLAAIETDIYYLIDKSKGWTKLDALTKDEQSAAEIYLKAREDIIKNYSSNPQNTQAKDYFNSLENAKENRYLLTQRIIGEFGSRLQSEIENIHDNIKSSLESEENKKIVSEYYNLKTKKQLNAEASSNIGILFDVKNKLEDEIKALQQGMQKSQKVLDDFSAFAENTFGTLLPEGANFKTVFELNQGLRSKANEKRNRLLTSSDYRNFLKTKEKLLNKKYESDKDARTKKIAQAQVKLDETQKKYNIIKELHDRKSVLTDNMTKLNTRYNDIHKEFKTRTVDKPNAVEKLVKRFEDIQKNILNKSKDKVPKMSDSFSAMYNAIGEAVTNLKESVNGPVDVDALKASIDKVAEKAGDYLTAKSKQWRPWPFASEQRFVRKMYARELVNLKSTADHMLQKLTANDLTVMRFFQKSGLKEVSDPEYSFDQDIKNMTADMKNKGVLHKLNAMSEEVSVDIRPQRRP